MKDKDHQSGVQTMLNKVPEITLFFWVIKILCTTVGETGADFLNTKLNLGLDGVTLIMGTILGVTLVFQFKTKKYVPGIYWLAVVLISIVGTLITDNLTDRLGIPLMITTIIFTVSLSIVFAVWYKKEKTLSIHTIITTRREAFYWLAILFTFALGTAAGDLLAETINLGYLLSAIIFGVLIAAVALSHFVFKVNAILAFWIAYILTRPLGASIGDYLSQDWGNGGLGLGTVLTSMIFLATILAAVIYLAITKKDVIRKSNFGDQV
ncbi:MAG: COG4705 family protein [Nitrosotalea sp.]